MYSRTASKSLLLNLRGWFWTLWSIFAILKHWLKKSQASFCSTWQGEQTGMAPISGTVFHLRRNLLVIRQYNRPFHQLSAPICSHLQSPHSAPGFSNLSYSQSHNLLVNSQMRHLLNPPGVLCYSPCFVPTWRIAFQDGMFHCFFPNLYI